MHEELTALVMGYGSIGRHHTQVLAMLTPSLVIVNRRASIRAQAARDYPSARIIEKLERLDGENFPWSSTIAVIATWGPSHAELFHALIDRGVRRILCEKPMASSVALAHEMAERARREGIVLGLNHTLRYAHLAPAVHQFVAEHQLGEPIAMIMTGGAAGLLTNGIHWLDFATELFKTKPQQVISTACGKPINPRSPDLMLYGGTAIWSFGEGREAVISFSNRSSIFPKAHIYFRDALITVGYVTGEMGEYIHVVARRRDRGSLEQYPVITRTGHTVELLFEGQLPGVLTFSEGLQAAAHELVEGDLSTCPGPVGVISVSACIGALLAARERKVIDLPIDPTCSWGQETWPIS